MNIATWFFGVVEDVNDPNQIGRVRVRPHVYYADKSIVPTDKLPWAIVLQDVTSADKTNNLFVGQTVFGFFTDEDMQNPVVMAKLAGTDFNIPGGNKFNDLPFQARTNVVDQDKAPKAAYTAKKSTTQTAVPSAKISSTWSEPANPAKAVYPYNNVTTTTSGHVIEVDDTPGASRIHTYHSSGSFEEYHPDGTHVTKIVKDNYTIVAGDDYAYINGDVKLTVGGDAEMYVVGDFDLKVGGNFNIAVGGNMNENVSLNKISFAGTHVMQGNRIDFNPGFIAPTEVYPAYTLFDLATVGGAVDVPISLDNGDALTSTLTSGPVQAAASTSSAASTELSQNLVSGLATQKAPTVGSVLSSHNGLGGLSSLYESNGNPGAIGVDSTGGYSYGAYQIATKTGTMDSFLAYAQQNDPEAYARLIAAGGSDGAATGSQSFKTAWKELAQSDSFAQLQHDFINATHYSPAVRAINTATDIDFSNAGWSDTMRDVVWSTGVQHGPGSVSTGSGGAARVVKNALVNQLGIDAADLSNLPDPVNGTIDIGGTTYTEAQIIGAVYDERSKVNTYFPNSTDKVKASVISRFNNEKQLALEAIG